MNQEEGDKRAERRKISLGGDEYQMPNHPVEDQPVSYHGVSRPDIGGEERKRGGFFSRRGSLILFLDIVLVAVLALTIYPIYGRKDRDRSMEHRFTLQAEADSAGVYFEIEVKSPRQEENLIPGELFTLQFIIEDNQTGEQLLASEPESYEFPLETSYLAYYRHYMEFGETTIENEDTVLARAKILTNEDEMNLRLELKKLN